MQVNLCCVFIVRFSSAKEPSQVNPKNILKSVIINVVLFFNMFAFNRRFC